MSKPAKFPGLQEKFEKAIVAVYGEGDRLSGRELLDRIRDRQVEFEIRDDELSDLMANGTNYFDRAKRNEVIFSHGRRRGYSLTVSEPVNPPELVEEHETSKEDKRIRGWSPWESFLHLPATLLLSDMFGAEVRSLAGKTGQVKWGNPDLLFVRESLLLQEGSERDDTDMELLRKVTSAPDWILSSVELKFDFRSDRSSQFQAIAETAANSSWANEAWLIFLDRTPSEEALEEDVLDLARKMGVGIQEMYLSENESGHELSGYVHIQAAYRPSLAISQHHRIANSIIDEAVHLLRDLNLNGTYLTEDGDVRKLARLLVTAERNLAAQNGFKSVGSGMDKLAESDAAFLGVLARATVALTSSIVRREHDNSVLKDVVATLRGTVTAEDAERTTGLIKELQQRASFSG